MEIHQLCLKIEGGPDYFDNSHNVLPKISHLIYASQSSDKKQMIKMQNDEPIPLNTNLSYSM